MSIQRRILITLQDIVAIDYECPGCKARFTVPLAINQVLNRCPYCQDQQWVPENYAGLQNFIQRLRELQTLSTKAKIRLEIIERAIPDFDILDQPEP